MSRVYTVGELARAAEVPSSTVRYYERRGLLTPERRNDANYRVFGAASLELLRFIRAAQAGGFRLRDIELLIALRSGTGDPCGEVRGVIERRLGAIAGQLDDLQHTQQVLRSALEWCERGEGSGHCAVLDGLERDPTA